MLQRSRSLKRHSSALGAFCVALGAAFLTGCNTFEKIASEHFVGLSCRVDGYGRDARP